MNLDNIKAKDLPLYYETTTHMIRVRKSNSSEKSTIIGNYELTADLIILEPAYQPRVVIATITPLNLPNFTTANTVETKVSKEDWDNKVNEVFNKLK